MTSLHRERQRTRGLPELVFFKSLWALFIAAACSTCPVAEAAPAASNLALGKTYTLDPAPNYPLCTDPGDLKQLTDGHHSTSYFWTDKSTVGWVNAKPVIITIDLGSVEPISGVSFNTAAGEAGVLWPESIDILVSEDKRTFYYAGELVSLSARTSRPLARGYAVHCFRTDELKTHGRYVALLVMGGDPFVFVDEIEVFKGDPSLLNLAAGNSSCLGPKAFLKLHSTQRGIENGVRRDAQAVRSAVEKAHLSEEAKRPLRATLSDVEGKLAGMTWPPPNDFRAVLPLNSLDETVFRVQGELWRALGAAPFTVWQAEPWAPLSTTQAPPSKASASLELSMMENEYRATALNISAASPHDSSLKLQVLDLPGGPNPPYIRVDEVLWTDTKDGTPVAAALQPAVLQDGAYSIAALPGLTRQVWLTVHSTNLTPGLHAGRVLFSHPNSRVSVPFSIHVYPLRFPQKPTLHLGGFDYTDTDDAFSVTPRNREALIAHLQEHFVDSPWATPPAMPSGKYDSNGVMVEPPVTAHFDNWLKRWPHARQYCVFLNVKEQFAGSAMGTTAFNQKVKTWIEFWAGHIRRAGLNPRQLVLLLVDEPYNADQDRIVLLWAKAIHAARTGVKIWEDPRHKRPGDANQEMMAECDVLCPNRVELLAGDQDGRDYFRKHRSQGKELALYSCSSPVRLLDPYAYFRLQPWHCWAYGASSCYFWGFSDARGESSWNEYPVIHEPNFVPFFLDPVSVTPGKHMEALREGVEDYEYLVMLRGAIARAQTSSAKAGTVERAKLLLQDAAARVCGAPGSASMRWVQEKDRSSADKIRMEILNLLVELHS